MTTRLLLIRHGATTLTAEDRFAEAKTAFREALALDAGFALAEQALLSTPENAATVDEIKAQLKVAPR